MKIDIKNLGPIENASIDISNITILCGDNNRGKTYLSYAIYGLYKYFHEQAQVEIEKEIVQEIISDGIGRIYMKKYYEQYSEALKIISKDYSKKLYSVFSVQEDVMEKAVIQVKDDRKKISRKIESGKAQIGDRAEIFIKSVDNDEAIEIQYNRKDDTLPSSLIKNVVSSIIGQFLFRTSTERPFPITSERTGIALFYKDLDINRNQILDFIMKKPVKDPFDLLMQMTSKYALPIKDNIDFTRDYAETVKTKSFIFADQNKYHEFINEWNTFIGGDYIDSERGTIWQTEKYQVPIYIASSAVKSLFILDAYIRHVSRKNDIVFIDEPELNLNPKRQIELARLLIKIAEMGVKIVLTTHSDYLLREINITLSEMYHNPKQYKVLNPDRINMYFINEQSTVELVEKDKGGFVCSFIDKIIDNQNTRYESIMYGDK